MEMLHRRKLRVESKDFYLQKDLILSPLTNFEWTELTQQFLSLVQELFLQSEFHAFFAVSSIP